MNCQNGDYVFIDARTKEIVSKHTEYKEVYFKQVELLGDDPLKLVYKDTFDGDIVIRNFGSIDYLLVFNINPQNRRGTFMRNKYILEFMDLLDDDFQRYAFKVGLTMEAREQIKKTLYTKC